MVRRFLRVVEEAVYLDNIGSAVLVGKWGCQVTERFTRQLRRVIQDWDRFQTLCLEWIILPRSTELGVDH